MDNAAQKAQAQSWAQITLRYRTPDVRRALTQLATALGLFFSLVGIMFLLAMQGGLWYAIVLPMAIPAGGFVVKLFILQHDCGHGSFLPGHRFNALVGHLTSVFTWTPYYPWRSAHHTHHMHSGNLEGRGIGDIDVLTKAEYEALSWSGKLWYRIMRHPLVIVLGEGPVFFLILQRFPFGKSMPFRETWKNTLALNIALTVVYGPIVYAFGWTALLVLGSTIYIATCIGVALFYVQHQFENVQWYHRSEWDQRTAAIFGSSYLKLPKILAWFTGDIGIHPLHHLNPLIPNYRLRECLDACPGLKTINVLYWRDVVDCFRRKVYDEGQRKLVPIS